VAEERVQYLAYYDALTGLPNRTLLQTDCQGAGQRRRQKDKVRFCSSTLTASRTSTTRSDAGGDCSCRKLQNGSRRGSEQTPCPAGRRRISHRTDRPEGHPRRSRGGERFMDAMTRNHRSGSATQRELQSRHQHFPEHGADGETLIKNADAAMYTAKDYGGDNFRFFTDEMNAQVVERLTLENSLRLALDRKELFLVYQPQMDIGTERSLGWKRCSAGKPGIGSCAARQVHQIAENSV